MLSSGSGVISELSRMVLEREGYKTAVNDCVLARVHCGTSGTEALDLTTPAGRAMAGLLAIFAEFEREILRERTRAGLAEARQNGEQLGRPMTAGLGDPKAASCGHQ